MGTNSAYSSRNLLGSLLVLQHKFLALGFFFQTFHLSIILARLAIGQSPVMSFLIMYYHVLSLPHSQYQVSHLQPPVSPFRLFWCFGLFSLPILTELIFSWMSYKDRTPGVWAKQDSPLKGETKWGVVRFAPKDCKNLAEKVVLLLCLMLQPVAWICTFGQPENVLKHTFVVKLCSWGFVEVIKGKKGQSRWDSSAD